MADVTAQAAAKLALKVGVVTEAQLAEAWAEVGRQTADAETLLMCLERKNYITPLITQKLLKGDPDGYILGGYRLLYKIASGSFGRVYRADEPATGRVVAVKVLRRRWSEDQHRIELFEREGKVGLSLRHPNIVEMLSIGRDVATRQYFLAMEFVEGGNLREILAIRKKLEPPEALRILDDCVNGLAYAYSKGVTHRDMKLTNVLISSQGTAKLVDFGLAGFFSSMIAHKGDGDQVDRTVDYAGLEKATGVKSGDVRSDIYFLGCVVYEMLTGRSPLLMTKDPRKRMEKERFINLPPMRRDEVNGPPSLFRLVETMMSLNPHQRYQTPSQLYEAVREVRREVDGQESGRPAAPTHRSVFVVERDERLQDAVRDKFKELGYRVFMAADPDRAIERFRQQPYDALVLDAGTTGEDGLRAFQYVVTEAGRVGVSCAGILVLSREQAEWADRVEARPGIEVMVRPITLKQLHTKLQTLVPLPSRNGE